MQWCTKIDKYEVWSAMEHKKIRPVADIVLTLFLGKNFPESSFLDLVK